MSWSLNVSGHVNADDELAKEIELAILHKVRGAISEIRTIEGNGIANATFIGYFVGPRKVTTGAD
jgi:hypothetical protein